MDQMTILKDAFTAPDYPAQTHVILVTTYFDFSRAIQIEWIEKATGKVTKLVYSDDPHSIISRMIGSVEQKQMLWFATFRAKVWLKHK